MLVGTTFVYESRGWDPGVYLVSIYIIDIFLDIEVVLTYGHDL